MYRRDLISGKDRANAGLPLSLELSVWVRWCEIEGARYLHDLSNALTTPGGGLPICSLGCVNCWDFSKGDFYMLILEYYFEIREIHFERGERFNNLPGMWRESSNH